MRRRTLAPPRSRPSRDQRQHATRVVTLSLVSCCLPVREPRWQDYRIRTGRLTLAGSGLPNVYRSAPSGGQSASCRELITVRSFFVHRGITSQSYGRPAGHQGRTCTSRGQVAVSHGRRNASQPPVP